MAKSRNNKHWKQVLAEAQAQGLIVEPPGSRYNGDGSRRKGGSHIKVSNPATGEFVYVDSTPSDWRGIRNNISWMRNAVGFVWDGRGGNRSQTAEENDSDEENSDRPARPQGAHEPQRRHARSRRTR